MSGGGIKPGKVKVNGSLVLIAGYPKSGTTWVRLVFEALSRSLDGSVAINELGNGFYGGWRRKLFDTAVPVNSAHLYPDEIDELLPDVYRHLAYEANGAVLLKAHDKAFRARSHQWLYPPDCVSSVIYLVRHPFDVAVSFAHHLGIDMPSTIAIMNRDHVLTPAGARMIMPTHERIGSWSGNIASWLDEAPYPLTLARYEDFHANPAGMFGRVVRAAGVKRSEDAIGRAIARVNFDRVRDEEQAHGFRERPRTSTGFFRAGKPRSWEGALDAPLRDLIVRHHGAMMERLGYTTDGDVRPLTAREA